MCKLLIVEWTIYCAIMFTILVTITSKIVTRSVIQVDIDDLFLLNITVVIA